MSLDKSEPLRLSSTYLLALELVAIIVAGRSRLIKLRPRQPPHAPIHGLSPVAVLAYGQGEKLPIPKFLVPLF